VADVNRIRPISRLLIANRGEISRRIIRTAHDMGIDTVAIYADSDRDSPFVREAGSAVALDGRSAMETYLDVDKVLNACRLSGADAVHPGYGFLSENADFARAVIDAGMIWIGPSPEVIRLMGDKLSAKKLMQEAGVPTLPAIEIGTDANVQAAAEQIGYPVLIKASAGGGGKGMRIVETADELEDAVAGARREALSSFADDTVFLEKWLDAARHVEIQIVGDHFGNLVHCFERECSIQRRHQKVIEEAPSPAVDADIRSRMCEAAVTAARKLGYVSAGTVEFLLTGSDFWFLEVNARLQVEHPVTEEIIGKDLVREQIRIAEGEHLSFSQRELAIAGHAIEARLYAEDPRNGFLPSPGPVLAWRPSAAGIARFDSGVETGSVIGLEFDPMIAKVIVHAPTRREAASRLARVLESTRIQGLTTNRDFLVSILRTPEFINGDTTTDFIDRVRPAPARELKRQQQIDAAIAAIMEGQARRRASAGVLRTIPSGWRHTAMPLEQIGFTVNDQELKAQYRARRDGKFRVIVDESEMLVVPYRCGDGEVDVEIGGRRLTFRVDLDGVAWLVHGPHGDLELVQLPRYPVAGSADSSGGLLAPMPGVVLSTDVDAGEMVSKGQLLLILEAMKMEHRITAPTDGIVSELHVKVGDQVNNSQLLVTLTDADEDN
jgi:propionyl-CoA carboxylase alpha chain